MKSDQRESLFDRLEPRQLLAFDPTAAEQYMLELTNRFRLNPQAELALLTSSLGEPARSRNADVDSALRFFNVSGSLLRSQWSSLAPAPPLAWNENLYRAAEFHSQNMITQDAQEHQLPGEADLGGRANAFNYTNWSNLGESIYAYADSIDHGHAGFLLDWGNGPGGIQDPPGHRNTAINPTFREIGIRVLEPGRRSGKQTGPLVITQDFGRRFNQGNSFLLGVAFGDSNNDRAFSFNEGLGGIRISAVGTAASANAPVFTTTSLSAGGWQLQVPQGRYNVTFAGGAFGGGVTYSDIVVGSSNVKLDAQVGVPPPAPVLGLSGNSIAIGPGDTTPSRSDFTDFGNANLTSQSITRLFTINNTGNRTLNFSGFARVRLTGSSATGLTDFRLVQDLPQTILAGQSATFAVQFDPSALGLRQAAVTITSNDPTTPTFSFAIQARGVQRPILQVSGQGFIIAPADVTPTTADWTSFGGTPFFGSSTSISPSGSSKVRIFTLSNTGLAPLLFTSASIDASSAAASAGLSSDPAAYSLFSLPTDPILPGQSAQVRVRFTPRQTGFNHVTLSLLTSDPLNPKYRFDLRGNGIAAARLEVFGGAASTGAIIPNNSITPTLAARTDFGAVAEAGEGTTGSRVRLFTIRNSGLVPLVLAQSSPVVIASGHASDFSISLPLTPGLSLSPGESMSFRVRFDPQALGQRSTLIQLLSSDPLAATFSFAISGLGI